MLNNLVMGAGTMPAFPKIEIGEGIQWLQNGFVELATSNGAAIGGAIVVIAMVPKAFGLVKKLISKVG